MKSRAFLFLSLAATSAGCTAEAVGTGSQNGSPTSGPKAPTQPAAGDDSAQKAPPAGAKRVFVTQTSYRGSLTEGGTKSTPTAAADRLCQAAADGAQLDGKWTAWLWAGTTPPADRIPGSGPWYLLDGRKAFNNASNLLTTPLVEVTIDETGKNVSSSDNVWTDACAASAQYDGSIVLVGDFRTEFKPWECAQSGHLYCFED